MMTTIGDNLHTAIITLSGVLNRKSESINTIKKNGIIDNPWIQMMQNKYKQIFTIHLMGHMEKDITCVHNTHNISANMSGIYAVLNTHYMSVMYDKQHPHYVNTSAYLKSCLSQCNAMDSHTMEIFRAYANWCITRTISISNNYPFLKKLHDMYASLNDELAQ